MYYIVFKTTTRTRSAPLNSKDERRERGRLNKVFSVYISGGWGSEFGIARNISEGGMFIEALDPYPLGGRMLITFSFPGSSVEMTAIGEVMHLCFVNRSTNEDERSIIGGMGVRFVGFVQQEDSLQSPIPALAH
jgi:hypothetical protein